MASDLATKPKKCVLDGVIRLPPNVSTPALLISKCSGLPSPITSVANYRTDSRESRSSLITCTGFVRRALKPDVYGEHVGWMNTESKHFSGLCTESIEANNVRRANRHLAGVQREV